MSLVTFNIVVLGAVFLLLICEEVRYRRFAGRVRSIREDLLVLSRQLRTPLSTIRKYSVFLRSKQLGNLSLSQFEALSDIDSATQDAIIGLNRLLEVSRLEEGMLAETVTDIDLRDVVRGGLDAVSTLVQQRGHHVGIEQPSLSLMVRGDPLILHGIIDELFLNAAAYTRPGGHIAVKLCRSGKRVQCSIRDTGIGISAADAERVFTKFFRGDQARAMYNGSGLGLTFAKTFAQLCGGSLSFTSKEGKGSTFVLELPAR